MSCPQCFAGHVHHGTPKGTIQALHGFETYIALPPNTATEPKHTIIFFCDVFGLKLVNNKLLADRYAAETGCKVLAPDFFRGGAASVESMMALNNILRPVPSTLSYLNPFMYAGKAYNIAYAAVALAPFALYNSPIRAFAECLRFTREVRAAMAPDAKLGVAGFCWGGYQVTKLACEPAIEGSGGDKALVDAVFTAHPSALKVPDDTLAAIETFKVPYSCAVAEIDFAFDKTVALKVEAALQEKEKIASGGVVGTYEFVVWDRCHHGFAVRASPDEGSIGDKGYEGAAKQAVDWFNKYLK